MGIIAETWLVDQRVQLKVHRLTGPHRLAGAIALGAPAGGSALLFERCGSVHGWFMSGPLDVVFIDREGSVLRVASLRPWRVCTCRGAAATLELAPGECARLEIAVGAVLKNISK